MQREAADRAAASRSEAVCEAEAVTVRIAGLAAAAFVCGITATVYAIWLWIDHGLAKVSW